MESMAEPRDGAADAGTGYVEAGLDSCETGQSLGETVAFLPEVTRQLFTQGGSRLAPPWNEFAARLHTPAFDWIRAGLRGMGTRRLQHHLGHASITNTVATLPCRRRLSRTSSAEKGDMAAPALKEPFCATTFCFNIVGECQISTAER